MRGLIALISGLGMLAAASPTFAQQATKIGQHDA